MRKLVSVKRVTDIQPIPDADLIVVATVDGGWNCVVKKGEFNIGDLGVYFEIDSFLPVIPEFEFLRKSSFKKMGDKEGFRLKTVRLKGTISQGLLIPYDMVKTILKDKEDIHFEHGEDLTEALGVEKYEQPIPACISGEVVGDFPSFIPKTDQERIQNLYLDYSKVYADNNDLIIDELSKNIEKYANRIEELKNNRKLNPILDLEFEATIKLDGTSMTVFVVDANVYKTRNIEKLKEELGDNFDTTYFGVCGRNYELREKEGNTYWDVANRDIKEKLINFYKETGRNIALQGELMGVGIQGNREKLDKHQFFCYEIWDIDKQRYLVKKERKEILVKLNIQSVPFIENIKVFKVFKTLDDILKYAEGHSINHPIREGVVFKSNELVNGRTISFKAISNLFLLKGGD